jgi:hypothetical protein
VHEGDGCAGSELGCNDDGGGSGGSSLDVAVTSGTEYTVVVAQYYDAPSDLSVALTISAL